MWETSDTRSRGRYYIPRGLTSAEDGHLEVVKLLLDIENHAEGDDTIQFMVSTSGKPVNGKNRGSVKD